MERLTVALGFGEFPPDYTCDGGNRSPAITLKGLSAASVALYVTNPFEPGCSFCPWLIWNLPPVPVIPAGIPTTPVVTAPVPAVQGMNDYGTIGYTGPCPAEGATHRYQFRVYGLDTLLDITPGSRVHGMVNAMKGHIVQFGTTIAMYRR